LAFNHHSTEFSELRQASQPPRSRIRHEFRRRRSHQDFAGRSQLAGWAIGLAAQRPGRLGNKSTSMSCSRVSCRFALKPTFAAPRLDSSARGLPIRRIERLAKRFWFGTSPGARYVDDLLSGWAGPGRSASGASLSEPADWTARGGSIRGDPHIGNRGQPATVVFATGFAGPVRRLYATKKRIEYDKKLPAVSCALSFRPREKTYSFGSEASAGKNRRGRGFGYVREGRVTMCSSTRFEIVIGITEI